MTDETAIRALFEQLTDAWDRGDGAAYGACFTADATYITYVGTLYRGAEEIGAAHQALFDSFLKGTKLACEIVDIRMTAPGSAVVVTRGDTYKKAPGKLKKLQTNTVVRCADGRWRLAAFQNTLHKSLMEAVSFRFQPATKPAAAPNTMPAAAPAAR
ncbi:SgcJ/EcaC family oxidoreductase [Actinomadura montaniterrae]|uniref:SgcJ/EcaC family oxidoreductase n=1 Tax=Actinomadura montaniterrae TaxID=1803903 RepID=A0A6L3VPX0_9ACTN|nr:SgcJ/EcaC family oxidoreductase [Actinomadura montaniterrae]KAB2377453.1 SgcJ/EcaC family oxidoreductase [Actinomadura montaniterrae]